QGGLQAPHQLYRRQRFFPGGNPGRAGCGHRAGGVRRPLAKVAGQQAWRLAGSQGRGNPDRAWRTRLMVTLYLSLGSNVAREFHICAALDALAERFGPLRISSVYESEAVGFAGEAFYNLVVGLETDLGLASLVAFLKQLEDANGRDRSQPKFSARTLDIDVLLYG